MFAHSILQVRHFPRNQQTDAWIPGSQFRQMPAKQRVGPRSLRRIDGLLRLLEHIQVVGCRSRELAHELEEGMLHDMEGTRRRTVDEDHEPYSQRQQRLRVKLSTRLAGFPDLATPAWAIGPNGGNVAVAMAKRLCGARSSLSTEPAPW